MNRIDRLLGILTTLQSRKVVSANFIANKYEISLRTVYRDIKALNEIGIPIGFENQQGYYIVKGFFLPPVSFTCEEANALILSVSLSEKFTDKRIQRSTDSALDKIKSTLKSVDKEKADFMQSQIKIYNPKIEGTSKDWLVDIQHAIINKQILAIDYLNNEGKESQREIEPIGLTFYSNQWHLIAWCWMRKAYRDFKTKQITQLANTHKRFNKEIHLDINAYIKSLS
jgi:predicted DNA-binding transcriptional regulator YafY